MNSISHLRTTDCRQRSGIGKTSTLLTLLVVLTLGACAPKVRVAVANDPSVDFSKLRTFSMLEPNRPVPSDNPKVDPFTLQRLRQLVYLSLKRRGYLPVDKESADLLVGVVAGQDEHVEVYSTGPYYGYNSMMGPPHSNYVQRSEYGILVIDIVERQKKSVIWRGTGERYLDGALKDPEMSEMVEAVLAQFPHSLGQQ